MEERSKNRISSKWNQKVTRRDKVQTSRRHLTVIDAVPIIFILGFVGLCLAFPPRGLKDYLKAVYDAAGLFSLGANSELIGLHPLLTAAVMLAPVVALGVALSVFRSLWIDRRDLWEASRARDHAVVVGLGPTGRSLVYGLKEAGQRVVAIDSPTESAVKGRVRSLGVPVVTGDATDPGVLEAASLLRARYLLIFADRDETALQCLDVARDAVRGRKNVPLRITVQIENFELREQLQQHEFVCAGEGAEVVYVGLADLAADIAADGCRNSLADKRVVVVGDKEFVAAIQRVCVNYELANRPIKSLTLFTDSVSEGPGSMFLASGVMFDKTAVREISELDNVRGSSKLQHEISNLDDTGTSDVLFISFSENALTRRWFLQFTGDGISDFTVVAVLREPTRVLSSSCSETVSEDSPIVAMLDLGITLSEGVFAPSQSWVESLARILHERYLEQARDKKWSGPAVKPWSELDEHYRDANRAQARALPIILGEVNCVIEVGYGPQAPIDLTDRELDMLADAEHQRWIGERLRNWERLNEGQRERAQACMIPYEDLSLEEKEKDREAMAKLLKSAAELGFWIHGK